MYDEQKLLNNFFGYVKQPLKRLFYLDEKGLI